MPLETMEERQHTRAKSESVESARLERSTIGPESKGLLVHERVPTELCDEPRLPEKARFHQFGRVACRCTGLMNRRIRVRTYGGVGGRGLNLPLLPDKK